MTHDRGAVAYGKRGKMRKAANAMVRAAPEQFTALAMPFLPELVEIMIADARDRECIGHRTAISGFLDGLKITGASDRMVEALVTALGASSMADLERGFARGRLADGATRESVDHDWLAYGRRRVKADPDFRERARQVLFGELVESESFAEQAVLPRTATNVGFHGSEVGDAHESPPQGNVERFRNTNGDEKGG